MGFNLSGDHNKHLGRFSSAGGLSYLDEALAKRPKRWPLFTAFMKSGEAKVTDDFLVELKDFIAAHTTKSKRRSISFLVHDIASDLLTILEQSKTKVIRITD